jgi:2OG-Fe(II) oxygenase superfamily
MSNVRGAERQPPDAKARIPAIRLDRLEGILAEEGAGYLTAKPWPHLVTDLLVDPQLAAMAEREESELGQRLRPHVSHREVKSESSQVGGPAAQAILDDLLTPEFTGFLERLTGIDDLVGDPDHYWAGLHVGREGSFQAVHSDFVRHPVKKTFHRVNVLVYLNSDWRPEYGGQLELWPDDMRACGQTVLPVQGRMVIFETNPRTLHGVPRKVTCPPDRLRLTLASYYFTDSAPSSPPRRRRLVQPRRPGDSWRMAVAGPSDAMAEIKRLAGQRFGRDWRRGGGTSGPDIPAPRR